MATSHRVVLVAILLATSGWGCSSPLPVKDKTLIEGGPRSSFQNMIARMKTPADTLAGPAPGSHGSRQDATPKVRKEEALPDEATRTKSLLEAFETFRTRSAQRADVASKASPPASPVPAQTSSPAPEAVEKASSDDPATPAAMPPAAALATPSPDRTASPHSGEVRILESGEYRIGPEDVIHVTVWDNKELTVEATVRPDGKISLPLIQDVQAQGLTASELADHLRERLSEFIKEPQASVIVTQVNAPKIYVLGNVQRPGPYPLRSVMSVLQALTVAGGFTPFASRKNIRLVRGAGERQEVRRVDYNDLIDNGGDVNYSLKPGDTIVVP